MPILNVPLALIALVGVPALIAIYRLRSKFRLHAVSTLDLWIDQRKARQGGRRFQRMQTPLLFFLELITLILLTLAAANPLFLSAPTAKPLVVVLDNSFSMLAGRNDCPRAQARKAIETELLTRGQYEVRFILAGKKPQSLGRSVKTRSQAAELLNRWKCFSPTANIERAVAFGAELIGPSARILVITDHRPDPAPKDGRIEWWAFGHPRGNLAFVNATRHRRDQKDRCLFEIANLSGRTVSTTLTIDTPGQPQPLHRRDLTITPNTTHRLFLNFDISTSALRATLTDDPLLVDNEVHLLPPVTKRVGTTLAVKNEALKTTLEKALHATNVVSLTTQHPHLMITDREQIAPAGRQTWIMQIIVPQDAAAYTGPFVLHRKHPLATGLDLDGVIWSAGKVKTLPGTPVITAGNVPLLTDTYQLPDRHLFRMRIRPDLSTLTESPSWPILFWNLVTFRAQHMPGLQRANVQLGADAVLTLEQPTNAVTVSAPDGTARTLPGQNRLIYITADQPGTHKVKVNDTEYTFAANALARAESDLTAAQSGRWGRWAKAEVFRWEYKGIAPILLLIALALLTAHAALVARQMGGPTL